MFPVSYVGTVMRSPGLRASQCHSAPRRSSGSSRECPEIRRDHSRTPILPDCYDQGCGLPLAVDLAHLRCMLWESSAMEVYSISSAAAAATAPRLNASGCQSQQWGVIVGTFALRVVALARAEFVHSDHQTPMCAVCVTCYLRCIQSEFVYTREDTMHYW